MATVTDITEVNWNGKTCDNIATVGTITATDRKGVARADGRYKIGVLPAGAILTAVYISTTKAFDKASTIGVGDATTAGKWAVVNCKPVAVVKGTLGLDVASTAAQDIVATIAFGGSVEGAVEVVFNYIDLGHRREMFTA